jgi:hypothetical protein
MKLVTVAVMALKRPIPSNIKMLAATLPSGVMGATSP